MKKYDCKEELVLCHQLDFVTCRLNLLSAANLKGLLRGNTFLCHNMIGYTKLEIHNIM